MYFLSLPELSLPEFGHSNVRVLYSSFDSSPRPLHSGQISNKRTDGASSGRSSSVHSGARSDPTNCISSALGICTRTSRITSTPSPVKSDRLKLTRSLYEDFSTCRKSALPMLRRRVASTNKDDPAILFTPTSRLLLIKSSELRPSRSALAYALSIWSVVDSPLE